MTSQKQFAYNLNHSVEMAFPVFTLHDLIKASQIERSEYLPRDTSP